MSKKLKLESKEEIKKTYTSNKDLKPSQRTKNFKKVNFIMGTNAIRKKIKNNPNFEDALPGAKKKNK